MDMQQEIHEIEEELLALITKKLEENKMEVETAQQLAKDFLAMLPVSDQQELLIKLRELSGKYEEVKPFYIKEYAKVDEMRRDEVLDHMRNAIHTGDIDGAITLAKAYSNKGGTA